MHVFAQNQVVLFLTCVVVIAVNIPVEMMHINVHNFSLPLSHFQLPTAQIYFTVILFCLIVFYQLMHMAVCNEVYI